MKMVLKSCDFVTLVQDDTETALLPVECAVTLCEIVHAEKNAPLTAYGLFTEEEVKQEFMQVLAQSIARID